MNSWTSLVAQMVKNLPAMQETHIRKIPWRREWLPTPVWRIPWTEEPGGLQSMGSQRVGHDWATNFHFHMWTLGCGMWDLVSRPTIESRPPALGTQSLSHWTTKEVPPCGLKSHFPDYQWDLLTAPLLWGFLLLWPRAGHSPAVWRWGADTRVGRNW